jgi:uncharacterized protein
MNPTPDRPAPDHPLLRLQRSSIDGWGLFAKQTIEPQTRVIEYTGHKITKQESLERCESDNRYIFCLNDEFDLDGNVPENLARFINHSCAPNCEAEQIEDQIHIIAIRRILPGDEITFNYGYDLESYRDYPCRCGTPQCAGFIIAEEFFPSLRSASTPERSPFS